MYLVSQLQKIRVLGRILHAYGKKVLARQTPAYELPSASLPTTTEPFIPKAIYQYDSKTTTWFPFVRVKSDAVGDSDLAPLSSFAVVTWNVDFMRPHRSARLNTILSYLQALTAEPLPIINKSPTLTPIPTIILIQEMHHTCFEALLEHPMVRGQYTVTDISRASWVNSNMHYGLVTLIPQSLVQNVHAVFRSAFRSSRMGREVLYTDFRVPLRDGGAGSEERIIRIANTHLESLGGPGDIARAEQLPSVARCLSVPGIHGGLVGGDMNPIGPLDGALPQKLNLVDAWLVREQQKVMESRETGQILDAAKLKKEGNTWGYQPPSSHPRRRMDKVLLAGNLVVKDIERIGVGLRVRSEEVPEDVWASDHYGLRARIEVL